MEKLKLMPVLLFVIVVLFSCKKDQDVNSEFEKSAVAWQGFKSSSTNAYEYSVVTQSFVGYKTETVLTVKDGRVIRRAFVGAFAQGAGPVISRPEERWTEELAELGTNHNGAEVLTLDQVYAKAKAQWLVKGKGIAVYFEVQNQGMISTAGYTEKGCTDDCFTGIKIGFIRKLTAN